MTTTDNDLIATLVAQNSAMAAKLLAFTDPGEAARQQLALPVPIRDWVDAYITHLIKKSESEFTVKCYRSTLNLFVAHVEAHGSRVDQDIIESFLGSRIEFSRVDNTANTWNRYLATIRSMFSWCVANVVKTNCPPIYREQALAVERKPKPISQAHPLTHTDWMAIWNSPLTIDERFWLGWSYLIGLRRFEVGSLTVGNIDITGPLQERGLHQFRAKGKGERRFRDVPYGLMASLVAKTWPDTVGRHVDTWFEVVEYVVKQRGPDPSALVCVRMDARDKNHADRFKWMNDDWAALRKKYGVTTHYKVHDLRDSCNTNLANIPDLSVDDRMRWIRHVDKATNDLYTHRDDERAMALLD